MHRGPAIRLLPAIVAGAHLWACSPELTIPPGVDLECVQNTDCVAPRICVGDPGRCVSPDSPCIVEQDGVFVAGSDGVPCLSDEVPENGVCVRGDCRLSICGDGVAVAAFGEECDDGLNNSDTEPGRCRTTCLAPFCGDGVTDGGEDCDDGNNVSGDGCSVDCRACGNGFVDDGECCDAGGGASLANPNDGCDDVCQCVRWTVTGGPLVGLGREEGDPLRQRNIARGIEADADGALYIANFFTVDRVGSNGIYSTLAGAPNASDAADGRDAQATNLQGAYDVALDSAGNIFLLTQNRRVRRVCVDGVGCLRGTIESVANASAGQGYSGDGGDALGAELDAPESIVVDRGGNIYIADTRNFVVRRICGDGIGCTPGVIETIAGNGTQGLSGDDGSALAAQFSLPRGLAIDADGNLLVTDNNTHTVRRICLESGACTVGNVDRIAGDGTQGYAGDDGAATAAVLSGPNDVAVDSGGNIFIADNGNEVIRKVCGDGVGCVVGEISTVVGTGIAGFSGDGGPATSAQLDDPRYVAVSPSGDVFIQDTGNSRVRRLCRSGLGCTIGNLDTVVGGSARAAEEGVPATSLDSFSGLSTSLSSTGDLFLAAGQQVRKLCLSGQGCTLGTLETVAGTGDEGFGGDGGPASLALIGSAGGVEETPGGDLVFTDVGNRRIRRVCLSGTGCTANEISTLAGNGNLASTGDGNAAVLAEVRPSGPIVTDAGGNIYFSESAHRVRKICVDGAGCTPGTIDTIAGDGTQGYSGDDGPAVAAQLSFPQGLAIAPDGNLAIADADNFVVRRVCLTGTGCTLGTIETIAGDGTQASTGDDGPATSAQLDPFDLDYSTTGNLFVLDVAGQTIRRICGDASACSVGTIERIAGGAPDGPVGDGAPALLAYLRGPRGVTVDADGDVYVGDFLNKGIRRICLSGNGCILGEIRPVAGDMYPQDGPFARAALTAPTSIAWLESTMALVADGAARVRRLQTGLQALDTVMGYPQGAENSGARSAFSRELDGPFGVAVYRVGSVAYVLVSERTGHTIRRITIPDSGDLDSWTAETWLGERGTPGVADGAPTVARFTGPAGLAVDELAGFVYVADAGNHVIRRIDMATDEVSTLAGVARSFGYVDASVATEVPEALFREPVALALGPGDDGSPNRSLYIADRQNNRVRRVQLGSDFAPISVGTVTGTGEGINSGQGQPANGFSVDRPAGVWVDAFGNLFLSSRTEIRVVSAGDDGVATGEDEVLAIYGTFPRSDFPESATGCLTGVSVAPDPAASRLYVLDACVGYAVELQRETVP